MQMKTLARCAVVAPCSAPPLAFAQSVEDAIETPDVDPEEDGLERRQGPVQGGPGADEENMKEPAA